MIHSPVQKIIAPMLLMVALSSCYSESKIAFESSSPLPEKMSQIESNDKNYTVFFSPIKTEMPLNRYFDMDIYVRGAMQQVIRFPLKMEIDAGMRAHNHGMNVKPNIEDLGQGHYKVKGMLFHMSGKWFLTFSLHRGVIAEKAETTVLVVQ
jgi:hypothetical protein